MIAFLIGAIVGALIIFAHERQIGNRRYIEKNRPTTVTHERFKTFGDSPVAGKIIPRDANGNPIVY